MKESRKSLNVNFRRRILALQKKWPAGYLDFRRRWHYHSAHNLLSTSKKKRRTASTHHRKQHGVSQHIQKWVLQFMKKRKSDARSTSNAKKRQKVECKAHHKKLPKRKTNTSTFTLQKSGAKGNREPSVQLEEIIDGDKNIEDRKAHLVSSLDSGSNSHFKIESVNGQSALCTDECVSTSFVKENCQISAEEEDGGSNATLVILKSCKRKKPRTLRRNATAATLARKQKLTCGRPRGRRTPFFMMCKNSSLIHFYQIRKYQKIRKRRNKSIFKQQLNECRFTEISGNSRERLDYKDAVTNVFSCSETEGKTIFKGLKHPSNMNTLKASPEHKEAYSSQFLLNGGSAMSRQGEMNFAGIRSGQETASPGINTRTSPKQPHDKNIVHRVSESLCSEQGSNVPVEESFNSGHFLNGTYSAEMQSPVKMDERMLYPRGNPFDFDLQGSSSSSGSVKLELKEQAENCTQMETEHLRNTDIFTTKLLDHLYCKSPLEEPTSSISKCRLEKEDLKEKEDKGNKSSVTAEQLTTCIHDFLDEFVKKYGSLIPLCEKDMMTKLKQVFNEDFSNRKSLIIMEIMKYQRRRHKAPTCHFQVIYNKHVLEVEDLSTLGGQNWLNDQIINMYGELIMDAVPDTVHFFNSFFHKQLVTRGYNGVKRWTKKVELFKKTLLLIPIHLEVHWSLITVDIPKKIISFYDSQGIHFKFCVENIRKYLYTEAKEKNYPEFLDGWQTTITKCIPQQKNGSDCGVFVLQYCKCLALGQPFQFSQEDMPRVRRRIYKELCECRLMD